MVPDRQLRLSFQIHPQDPSLRRWRGGLRRPYGHRSANADNLRIVTGEFPPLTNNSTADKGLLFDMVTEMAKLMKTTPRSNSCCGTMPRSCLRAEKNVLIFPMTRTPQREASFTWVIKIFDMNRPFTSLPDQAVDSMEEAKAAGAVGVLEKSASLTFLKEGGITKIIEFPPTGR